MMFCYLSVGVVVNRPGHRCPRTHPPPKTYPTTYRRLSGRGLLEAADLNEEGGEAMKTTTIREEMTTSTTSDSVHPTQQ